MTEDELRGIFETREKRNSAWGFKRSRKGHYVNPATARDWKWFRLGAEAKRAAMAAAEAPALTALRIHHEWSIRNMQGYSEDGDERVAYRATVAALATQPKADSTPEPVADTPATVAAKAAQARAVMRQLQGVHRNQVEFEPGGAENFEPESGGTG